MSEALAGLREMQSSLLGSAKYTASSQGELGESAWLKGRWRKGRDGSPIIVGKVRQPFPSPTEIPTVGLAGLCRSLILQAANLSTFSSEFTGERILPVRRMKLGNWPVAGAELTLKMPAFLRCLRHAQRPEKEISWALAEGAELRSNILQARLHPASATVGVGNDTDGDFLLLPTCNVRALGSVDFFRMDMSAYSGRQHRERRSVRVVPFTSTEHSVAAPWPAARVTPALASSVRKSRSACSPLMATTESSRDRCHAS